MSRLIDGDALSKETGKLWEKMPDGEELSKELMKAINHAPTIDAVPVVRCKDCVYYKSEKLLRVEGSDYFTCPANGGLFGPDDYCSSGERS